MKPNSFYPRANTDSGLRKKPASLSQHPQTIGPILDIISSTKPLALFDEVIHADSYVAGQNNDGTSKTPPKPEGFVDPYLYPMLTRNERLRLTTLWYHTRDLVTDDEFLARTQAKVDLLKELIGWEYAICGLLDNNVYQRVATAGLPLAVLPRRECTCAHTVQQSAGSVFFIPDMSRDWRFAQSPHVAQGGLRSYAGAQLRVQVDNDGDISLGSLCIASNTPNQSLTSAQMDTLAQFADMLTDEVVNGSRRKRAKQQERMDDLLREAFVASLDDDPTEIVTMRILNQVFPQAQISLLPIHDGSIQLQTGGPVLALHEMHVESAVWEDDECIDQALRVYNHDKLKAEGPVRAIIAQVRDKPSERALVVSTTDITHIFDDIDVRFVEGCAMILRSITQETSLQNASKARERFMRGITHQLRTPIHGILASVDLLADELSCDSPNGSTNSTALENVRMIKSSGRELMSTVNNVIKFNRWAESTTTLKTTMPLSDLNRLETDILEDISWLLPEDRLDHISIFFNNTIPLEIGIARIDMTLLRDCLQSLVLNALQNTTQGSVIVTTSVPPDHSSIVFDIRDTGCGIALADRQRIFDAYEKANSHSTGAGLGLTLATKIAHALGGTITLESSDLGVGSHFRVEFSNPGLACPTKRGRAQFAAIDDLPENFSIIPSDPPSVLDMHFTLFLKTQGMKQTDEVEGQLAVVSFTHLHDQYDELLTQAAKCALAISLVPAGEDLSAIKEMRPNILFFTGPFTSDRLNWIITETRNQYAARRPLQPPPLLPPQMTTTATTATQQTSSHVPEGDTKLRLGHQLPLSSALSRGTPNTPRNVIPQCLLVDDNLINLRILRMYCDKRKYPYTTALDGFQAIDEFTRAATAGTTPIDLILLDLQMPKCDGILACQEIRAIEVRDNLLPTTIFIVTGQDSAIDKKRSFAAGADEYFVKPIALKSLDVAITKIFGKAGVSG